jgi:signal recognition particle GTPase
MNTNIQELSLEELKAFINEVVDKRLEQHLGDPDVGLEIKPEIIERIRKSRRQGYLSRSGSQTLGTEVVKTYGLISAGCRDNFMPYG